MLLKKVKYKSLSQNSVQYQKKKKTALLNVGTLVNDFCGCKYFQFFFFSSEILPNNWKEMNICLTVTQRSNIAW